MLCAGHLGQGQTHLQVPVRRGPPVRHLLRGVPVGGGQPPDGRDWQLLDWSQWFRRWRRVQVGGRDELQLDQLAVRAAQRQLGHEHHAGLCRHEAVRRGLGGQRLRHHQGVPLPGGREGEHHLHSGRLTCLHLWDGLGGEHRHRQVLQRLHRQAGEQRGRHSLQGRRPGPTFNWCLSFFLRVLEVKWSVSAPPRRTPLSGTTSSGTKPTPGWGPRWPPPSPAPPGPGRGRTPQPGHTTTGSPPPAGATRASPTTTTASTCRRPTPSSGMTSTVLERSLTFVKSSTSVSLSYLDKYVCHPNIVPE